MTIPFTPESIDTLKKRFKTCLDKTWNVPAGLLENPAMDWDRPSKYRSQTFDFDKGLRLIISKDKLTPDSHPIIHVSASWRKDATEYPRNDGDVLRLVSHYFHEIGGQGVLSIIGISQGGIAHFLVEAVN